MNCQNAKLQMADLAAGTLPAPEQAALQAHIAECELCARRWRWEQKLAGALRHDDIPEPSADFERRVLAAVTGGQASPRRIPKAWWGGGGIAAALVVGVFLGQGMQRSEPVPVLADAVPVVDAPIEAIPAAWEREQTVRLAFSSGSALENVSLTLELPPHVELARFPGHRELTWRVNLQPGDNIIALPLRIAYPDAGELVAHLDDGTSKKTFRAPIPGLPLTNEEPSS
ncbi:MAG: zf-HC2 domain-containing protein [Marinobacter sp.]|nr:zf-HC2 domain-containing protein [Marinobacter sp.]